MEEWVGQVNEAIKNTNVIVVDSSTGIETRQEGMRLIHMLG